jgi:diaminohydroxyphosphoribosylaminopyrimidine deaminase/5-amino-6-(5-phosphoribosylamino)uracil reductase
VNDDASFMARALQLAARGKATTHPNPRVGCVLVRDGANGSEIVGEGWHERAGEPHAEVHALRAAGARASGATAYVTLEPCAHHGRTPPCADALVAAGVARVVAAVADPFPQVAGRGLAKLREAGIATEVGVLEPQARALNRGFLSRLERGRPWMTLKLAMSLDGRTAMASGESRWITGEAARADVHRLRAEAGAVLTTSETVLADDPELTVRGAGSDGWRQPDRVVLDQRGRIPDSAKVWRDGARRFHFSSAALPLLAGVERIAVPAGADGRTSLPAALKALAGHEVNEVLVECGPRLAGALLREKLVDELIVYCAPKLLGDAARPLVALPGLEHLADHIALEFTAVETIGADLKITARVAGGG